MKNKCKLHRAAVHLLSFFLVLSFFSSCRSNKDLTMLKDLTIPQTLKGYPEKPPEHYINDFDNLYVSIVSSNKDMNELYNPAFAATATGSSNTSLIYNEVAGQYIYGYRTDADGDISLPLIGKVNVRGMTLQQSEAAIYTKAKEFLKEVSVKVRLLNYKITVMGEVTRPGVYYNYNYDFTVMDAISTANGITNSADLENVLVLRPTPTGSQTFNLNLSSKESLKSKAYHLQPNDIVFVQPSKYKNVQLRVPIYTLIISSATAIFFLLTFVAAQ